PGTSNQRNIVAPPPATRTPLPASVGNSASRLRRYASRVRSTCSSSFHATIDARCTNSWGAVPTDGRYCFNAPISSASAATKPERYPVIEERLLSVLKTATFPAARISSAEWGGLSNHSSEYASSQASRNSYSRDSAAARRRKSIGATAPVG